MSRVLFVVPPLVGHVNPTVGVGAELAARGHDVAWVGHAGAIGHLLPVGARVLDCGDAFLHEAVGLLPDRSRLRGVAALRFLWELFIVPLARDMAGPVTDAVRTFRPDVVVADQQTVAGPVVADRLGVPWVTSAISSAEFTDPLTLVPKVAAWVAATRDGVLAELGVPAERIGAFDPLFSPTLTLLYSSEALSGPLPEAKGPVASVGPVLGGRPERDEGFPWDWLDAQPATVLVSLGTLNTAAGERFVRRTIEAVTGLGVSAVVVAPEELVGPVPPTVVARPSVPQLAILPHVDVVVCHAGHNTVCEALAHGVPLVVAPIRDDQPIVAGQVVRSGTGRRVPLARATVADIADAVRAVRADAAYAAAAGRVAASFARAGGAARAADLVLDVARAATVPTTASI